MGFVLAILLLAGMAMAAAPDAVPRISFPHSIRELAATPPADGLQPRIERQTLTLAEMAGTMDFQVALQMRNRAELLTRVARHEVICPAEMQARYYPLTADYDQLVAWLTTKGFTITQDNPTRLAVFARGPVSLIGEVFQTTFARVACNGSDYTAATSAPSLPIGLAPAVLGVNGLQPYLRMHKLLPAAALPQSLATPYEPPFLAGEFLKAYNAVTTGLTGAGETIAIVIDLPPNSIDLTTYWSRCGISQSLTNVQVIPIATGTDTDIAESAIDTELTSSIAPAAKLRVYTTGDLDYTHLYQAYTRILADLPSQPGLNQLNLSYGGIESQSTRSQRQADSDVFAALAAGGVTVFASTGDGGSNPGGSRGYFSATAPLQTLLPASDPSVTAVGATSLTLNLGNGAWSSEVGWDLTAYGADTVGSGGGISTVFTRPSWQTGPGVPAGSMRMVPDVSIAGDPSRGGYFVVNGSESVYGGTSISAPLWTGFCALINGARIAAGREPIGLFGPQLYPLIGTAALHDITSGTNTRGNGAYFETAGYDMVTGAGTPDVAMLLQALSGASFAPEISTQPASQTVAPGQDAAFTVTANGSPVPTYRWQRQPAGTTTWNDLGNANPYSGATSATLSVSSVTEAMSGDLFQCVITNSDGTVTTAPAALIAVRSLTISTLAGTAGIGGSADGMGTAARFNHPSDLAVDVSGNLYVTDTENQTIRRVTPAGVVTTLAGTAGAPGTTDGNGAAARFHSPTGVAIDGSGNLYVADTDNDTIRKVSPTGDVTTVAGAAGAGGNADGSVASARFNRPSDVAFDAAGNLYVADAGNDTIRKIDLAAGTVTTIAGMAGVPGNDDGTGATARFNVPEGVAADAQGNLYVADAGNSAIRKIALALNAVATLAGLPEVSGTTDGVGSGARFQFPADLAVGASGNLYVADADNHAIRQVSPAGAVGIVAGLAGTSGSADGNGRTARFLYPTGITADAAGAIYVADTNNNTVRKGMIGTIPLIATQPQSQTVTVGANVQFSVVATGSPAPTYQWNKGGVTIAGAISSTLSLSNVQTTDAGTYTVTASNPLGSVTSGAITLTVNAAAPPPAGGGGSGGGGGGGGAMEGWLVLTLVVFGAARRLTVPPQTGRTG